MNSKNSNASNPHRLLLNLSEEIDLKRSDKYVALSNLSIYYTLKNIKKSYQNNKLKYQPRREMKNLSYLTDHILYEILKIILNVS